MSSKTGTIRRPDHSISLVASVADRLVPRAAVMFQKILPTSAIEGTYIALIMVSRVISMLLFCLWAGKLSIASATVVSITALVGQTYHIKMFVTHTFLPLRGEIKDGKIEEADFPGR